MEAENVSQSLIESNFDETWKQKPTKVSTKYQKTKQRRVDCKVDTN